MNGRDRAHRAWARRACATRSTTAMPSCSISASARCRSIAACASPSRKSPRNCAPIAGIRCSARLGDGHHPRRQSAPRVPEPARPRRGVPADPAARRQEPGRPAHPCAAGPAATPPLPCRDRADPRRPGAMRACLSAASGEGRNGPRPRRSIARATMRSRRSCADTAIRRFLALKQQVTNAVATGADPSAIPVTDQRFARTNIRVTLRQLKAQDEAAPSLDAWLAAHERHGESRRRSASPRGCAMNGIHDMGGMEGFGPVQPEPNEPPFHSEWEGRALAMNRALGYAKIWNIDKSRAKIEEMPPHDYLTRTYYQKWAYRLEQLLIEYGYIGEDEVEGRTLAAPGQAGAALPARRRGEQGAVARQLFARADRARALQGRRPRAHQEHPSAHAHAAAALRPRQGRRRRMRARLPRVPGLGRDRRRARTRNGSTRCCSTPRELWGEAADPKLKVSIEAWDPYLEPA